LHRHKGARTARNFKQLILASPALNYRVGSVAIGAIGKPGTK
jgi:hypothetical protein